MIPGQITRYATIPSKMQLTPVPTRPDLLRGHFLLSAGMLPGQIILFLANPFPQINKIHYLCTFKPMIHE